MFRTVLVHHQEQLYKLYIAFGICRYMPVPYVWLLCGYNSLYTYTYSDSLNMNMLAL